MTARYPKPSRGAHRSGHAHALALSRDHVADVELPTPAHLPLAVDGDAAIEQQGLRLCPRTGDPRQLEQLAEPDRVTLNLDLLQSADVARWQAPTSRRADLVSTLSEERRF